MSNIFNVDPTPAPELAGTGQWFNSDGFKLSSLKDKVILIDFWAYGCINCVHVIPHLQGWYDKYSDKGLVVLGVHTPEFDTEKDPENLEHDIEFRKITYQVDQDNDYKTWNAYGIKAWPTTVLIDKQGQIRRIHIGEGEYKETEKAIKQLLEE